MWSPSREVLAQTYRDLAVNYRQRPWLHVLLFVATVASTSLMVSPTYSACVMAILVAHEFGHYFAARHHLVPATLPYFIPVPFFFGTMGAIIRMSPLIPNRRALFDIAAAGPLAGIALAVPISFVGIAMSERVPLQDDFTGIVFGDPLLFQAFERVVFGPSADGAILLIHDIAFAGWVGLFVTALNLLPIGQLDGGHIAFAALAGRSRWVAWGGFGILCAISLATKLQYVLLLVLLLLMGIRHPPTLDDSLPLGRTRRMLALLLVAVFVLCFVPDPITIRP